MSAFDAAPRTKGNLVKSPEREKVLCSGDALIVLQNIGLHTLALISPAFNGRVRAMSEI